MRREEKKKLFSKKNLVTLFIVFIMVTSVVGYMFGKDGGDKFKYGDYSFSRQGNNWVLKIDKIEYVFDFFPAEVEDINLSLGIIDSLKGVVEIDFTSSVNDSYAEAIALAQYNFVQNLGKISNAYVRIGMIDENDFDLPIITCKDATSSVPVLYFKEANVTKVEFKNSCISVEAKSEIDILRIKDRLLYGLLGII